MKIFISYAREDKAHAKSLAEFLTSKGHEVWWDHLIHAGTDFRGEIIKQLAAVDKVVVLWSSHSVRSPFVIDEAQRANESGKLIPVVMDVSQPPMGFGHLHAVKAPELSTEFPAILAAAENRAPPTQRQNLQRLTTLRRFLAISSGIAVVLAVSIVVWWPAERAASNSLGCYAENRNSNPIGLGGRVLGGDMIPDDPAMTVERCVSHCRDKGFDYAGLQYSKWCFCGNSYDTEGPASNCNMFCSGDKSQECGGSYANSVYATRSSR